MTILQTYHQVKKGIFKNQAPSSKVTGMSIVLLL